MRFFRETIIVTLLATIGGSDCLIAAELQSIPTHSVIRRLPPVDSSSNDESPSVGPVLPSAAEPVAVAAPLQSVETVEPWTAPVSVNPEPARLELTSPEPADQLVEVQPVVEEKRASSPDKAEAVVESQPEIDPRTLLSIQLPVEVVTRTKSMLKDATTLANRGAHYAAREQFEKIMRVTCQALDAQVGRPIHTRGLARGLRAIEEADDFGLNGDSPESDLRLDGFIAGHSTPVLKDVPSSEITTILAMQAYYRYAVEQLSIAGNNEPISSQALFSLGRIESMLSIKNGELAGGGPKPLAFYHAALAVNPKNGRAANELGVMLARRGRWQDARNVLHEAARNEPMAVMNLAKVYGQLGDQRRSQQMAQQAQMIAARNPTAFKNGPSSGVRWVDNSTFVKEGAGNDVMPNSGEIRSSSGARPTGVSKADFQPAAPKKKKMRTPFVWGR